MKTQWCHRKNKHSCLRKISSFRGGTDENSLRERKKGEGEIGGRERERERDRGEEGRESNKEGERERERARERERERERNKRLLEWSTCLPFRGHLF
jgi:hypothetical protein